MVSSLITSQEIAIRKADGVPAMVAVPHVSYDRQLSCQIWGFDGTLVGRSESAPGQPLTDRKTGFTAFAAHELRTPIAGLKTQAQIALGSDDEAIRKNALRQITVGVDRTGRLVRQLTDLTNAESGELEDDVGHVDVGRTLQTLADDIGQHHGDAASVSISAEVARLGLRVNPSLFMLGVRNLLENAVLHSPPDKPFRCGLLEKQGFLAVTIDDYGPGIPEDELPKVRARFFRGRNQTATGSGLGLAIAERAAERMGATLHLENRTEGGLRTELRFKERIATSC